MKYERIEVRMNQKEKRLLLRQAQTRGVALSEYIRGEMLAVAKKEMEHKRDMTAFTTYGFFLLKRLAEKQLEKGEIDEAKGKMLKALEDYKMREAVK